MRDRKINIDTVLFFKVITSLSLVAVKLYHLYIMTNNNYYCYLRLVQIKYTYDY